MSAIEGRFDVSGFINVQPVRERQYAVTAINQLCGATHNQRMDVAARGAGTDLFFRSGRSDGRLPVHTPLVGSCLVAQQSISNAPWPRTFD
jgi:hypothetical protein